MTDRKTPDEWFSILFALSVREKTARAWAEAFSAHVHPGNFNLGWPEIDDFVAQIVHESVKLERVRESLSYRAERLMQVWPKRFPTIGVARQYAGQPAKLAEYVYGMRADLGNDQPGDGVRYIGRGPIQVTGKANYELAQTETGEPLVDKPELLETPRVGLLASIAWWEKRIPDSAIGNVDLVSRRVNGGSIGLEERRKLAAISDQVINQA